MTRKSSRTTARRTAESAAVPVARRLKQFFSRRAASFSEPLTISLRQSDHSADLLFAVGGDLYAGESVLLEWIQDLRDVAPEFVFDFIIAPLSPAGHEWNGATVLYEHRSGSPHQGA